MIPELARYWTEVLRPYKPLDWSIPNTVAYQNSSVILRRFGDGNNMDKPAIVVLAPNAGHHMNICEPLIKRCLRVDAERPVYLVDWIPPTPDSPNRFDSLNDIISNIAKCVEVAGGKAHLFTLCQGAWAGAIYTALYPDTVLSYTDGAGPIDFCADGGKIQNICQTLPMSFYENMVNLSGGVQRGEFQLMGFKGLNPYERYVGDYLDLWYAVCAEDEKAIEKWHKFKDWYDQPQNVPGVWYLEAVEKLFKNNLLVKGELEVLGREVNLNNIKCPIFLIAGEKDDITPPAQVFHMENHVNMPVTKRIIEKAGHIGVFVKESSLNYWETAIISKLGAMDPIAEKAKAA